MELTWDNAKEWQEKVNAKKEVFDEPKWDWDCQFKLDFDGSLLRISSRFYPPHRNLSKKWEGKLAVLLMGKSIIEKEFKCDTLEKLHKEVEKFKEHYVAIVKSKFT